MICEYGGCQWLSLDWFPFWLVAGLIALTVLIYLCAAWQGLTGLRKGAGVAFGGWISVVVTKLAFHFLGQ